jgi:heme-degrading monooxygenase HmoA
MSDDTGAVAGAKAPRRATARIGRIWRGATRAADAEEYLEVLRRTGFAEYRSTPGNLGVVALRRIDAANDRAELTLLTLWESMEAVRRFAGPEPERAVFYPEDERYLVERGERVEHFEVVFESRGGAE